MKISIGYHTMSATFTVMNWKLCHAAQIYVQDTELTEAVMNFNMHFNHDKSEQ